MYDRRQILAGSAALVPMPFISRIARAQRNTTLLVASAGVAEGVNPDILKAFTQPAVIQVYENLTRYGRSVVDGRPYADPSKLEPHMAESWRLGEDGKSFIFKLRTGVRSFYGNELTAEDVAWSWKRGVAARRTGVFVANVATVVSVEPVSKYEVRFQLAKPNFLLPHMLTAYVPGLFDSVEVRRHATADDPWAINWTERNTAGFGAYHLESIRPGEQAVWVANPNYFQEGRPYFKRVIQRAVPSAASRVTLLKSRQVHWIDDITFQQIRDLQNDRNVKVQSAVGRRSATLRMNPNIKPFDDLRVRLAINHAVDRSLVTKTIFGPEAEVATSFVPPGIPGGEPVFTYAHDVAKARQLLQEAGHGAGLEIEIAHSDENWWQEQAAIQVSNQLRAAGITARPTKISVSDLRARTSTVRHDLPFFCFEEGPFVLDALYAALVHVESKGVNNRIGFKDPELDTVIEDSKSILDDEKRLARMKDVQLRFAAQAPWVALSYPPVFRAMAPSITGWLPEYIDRWAELSMG